MKRNPSDKMYDDRYRNVVVNCLGDTRNSNFQATFSDFLQIKLDNDNLKNNGTSSKIHKLFID